MPWTTKDVGNFKKDLSDAQKRKWVSIANDTLKNCLDKGGKESECAASAIKIANSKVQTNSFAGVYNKDMQIYKLSFASMGKGQPTTKMYMGKKHIILPVVMLVEGVHNGSHGPLLHVAEEFGKFVDAWNDIPITIMHPEQDGYMLSAADPDILDTQFVGRVYNSRIEDGKLKGDAWIDEQRLENISQQAYIYIKSGKPLDVSIGTYSDEVEEKGDWQGEEYNGVSRNYRPNHLALLPGAEGACSWTDGCGVRVNNITGNAYLDDAFIKGDTTVNLDDVIRESSNKEKGLNMIDKEKVINALTSAKAPLFTDKEWLGTLKPECLEHIQAAQDQHSKAIQEQSKVTVDKAVEVLSNSGVDDVLAKLPNKITADKAIEILSKCDADEVIAKLPGTIKDKLATNKKGEPKQMKKEDIIEALKEHGKDINTYLDFVPPEVSQQIKYGIQAYNTKRNALIDNIVSNTEVFTKDELSSKDITELEKLDSVSTPQANYAPLATNIRPAQPEEKLLPPGVVVEK